jgi:spore coat protein H
MNALFASLLLVCSTGGELFEGLALKTVRLEITADHLERLRAEPRRGVPAKLQFESGPAEEISLRLKGRGTFQPIDQKPNFTITRSSVPTKFHLNNSLEDPSYLKEKIGSELFRTAGIPAPNVAHARVKLNDKDLGLYVLKEGFTREFIERSFGHGNGRLYDTDGGSDVDQSMEQDLGAADDTQLKRLAAAATESDLAKRFERLDAILDLDQFISFLALEMLICHWDGYALSKNNFRIYFDPQHNRIRFLPAGLDQIFAKADLPWEPTMSGLAAKSLLETPQGQLQYDAKFRKLYETFSPEKLATRIIEIVTQLRPSLTHSEATAISTERDNLIRSIHARKESLRKQLNEAPITFPEFENGVAEITGWQATDNPPGGNLLEDVSALRILAGPKTSASWRKTVRLRPGHYTLAAAIRTSEVAPLPFGTRHGAALRVFGKDSQSATVLGTSQQALVCQFEVESEQEVTLICELRASRGTAKFEKPIRLAIKPRK